MVPEELKEYFAEVARQGIAEQRGLRPFSPVYPEELDRGGAAQVAQGGAAQVAQHSDSPLEIGSGGVRVKPAVNIQRTGGTESEVDGGASSKLP